MEWGHPANLHWLWAVVVTVLMFVYSARQNRRRLDRLAEHNLAERLSVSLNHRVRWVKKLLVVLAVFFLVIALAQPHFRKTQKLIERRGIDLMVAVDVSLSMNARDVAPSRLEKAKMALSDLLESLKGDRIGLLAFAGDGIIQSPLTLDQGAVKLFLVNISPELVSRMGSSVARAILTAIRAYPEEERLHRALVVFSDGEDHEGGVDTAIQKAKEVGLKVFTVGIGTEEGSTIPGLQPDQNVLRDSTGEVVITRLNEGLLRKIAQQTGGVYYRATRSQDEIDRLARDLNQIEAKKLQTEMAVEYEESFQLFLLAGFLCLIAEMLLSERKRHE
ncbi:MAG: VWA domain-containing protein [Candidatus Omnitrophota bacterium]